MISKKQTETYGAPRRASHELSHIFSPAFDHTLSRAVCNFILHKFFGSG